MRRTEESKDLRNLALHLLARDDLGDLDGILVKRIVHTDHSIIAELGGDAAH